MIDDLEYVDKVGLVLINMPLHGVFVIAEKVRPENRALFIQVVKNYIDRNFGHNEGWQLTFNSDYSKIRKDYFSPIFTHTL